MTFYIYTLGCKVNTYESELMKELLLKEHYVWDEATPDIIIVNTCSVTNVADHKSMKMVRHFKKNFPNAILVVCGCSSQNKEKEYQELGIDILLGNQEKSKIVSLLHEYLKTKTPYQYINASRNLSFEDMRLERFQTHTRAFVKIQDGCDNFCSYCVIPYVRGSIRSKEITKVLEEVHTLVMNHHQEIVLTGIHTGSYGANEDYDLTDLIHEMSKEEQLKRIRISSIEITELNEKFLEELKNNPKICNHLHIPLQAGSDEILKKMNRKYDLAYFSHKLEQIRQIRPDIAITTDVIVGHPYETEELFEQTKRTVKAFQFAKIHVFPYSKREKTKASIMPMQVEESEKKKRSRELVQISNELEESYYRKYLNTIVEVLVEQSKEDSIGCTENYLKVKILGKFPNNTFVNVKIIDFQKGSLIGIPIS